MKNRIYQCVKLQDPPTLIHIHPPIREKPDAFRFQHGLPQLREASAGDGAVLHYHALPGQPLRAEAHGAPDLPRRAGPAQHPGDLAVGHDLARRDLSHDVINLLIERIHKYSPKTPGFGYKKTAIY